MTPLELHNLQKEGKAPKILDVRELFEYEIANLGGTHIPLGELAARADELDSETPWVVVCHHGVRSAQAAGFLRQKGFAEVHNLSGGIDRWSLEVDPRMPRY